MYNNVLLLFIDNIYIYITVIYLVTDYCHACVIDEGTES
jgi:hypothetical protein